MLATVLALVVIVAGLFAAALQWKKQKSEFLAKKLSLEAGGLPPACAGLVSARASQWPSGRVFVITGASVGGIGFEVAQALAALCLHKTRDRSAVVLACRSEAACAEAAARIGSSTEFRQDGVEVVCVPLNLVDPSSILNFRQRLEKELSVRGLSTKVDSLVCNAGVGMVSSVERVARSVRLGGERLDLAFATNHIGHAALVEVLTPLMRQSDCRQGARIVMVTSSLHKRTESFDVSTVGRLDNMAPYDARGRKAYHESKLCNVIYAAEWNRRETQLLSHSRNGGAHISALAVHPGLAATRLGRLSGARAQFVFRHIVCVLLGNKVSVAAAAPVHAASAEQLPQPVQPPLLYAGFEVAKRALRAETPSPVALDVNVGEALWQLTQSMLSKMLR